ncbi:hypothetical protein [Pseudidiomarina sp.]|uniref:hypothetical protein n=1 Tax=Pseudidiomarina sp. TaxID=2081707 RepID=UPI003A975264
MEDKINITYHIPFTGKLILNDQVVYRLNDYIIEFEERSGYLYSLKITFEEINPKTKEDHQPAQEGYSLYESRRKHLEILTANLSSAVSMTVLDNSYFDFEKRVIDYGTIKASLGGGFNGERKEKSISIPQLDSTVVFAMLEKEIDPSYTFYVRGFSDMVSRRYIEAFYNLFFFLEYLYGNGKSGKNKTVQSFLKNSEVVAAIDHVKKDEDSLMFSKPFGEFVKNSTPSEIIGAIYDVRGTLHHPNVKRRENWKPMRQLDYQDQCTLLGLICGFVASRKFIGKQFEENFSELKNKIQKRRRKNSKLPIIF